MPRHQHVDLALPVAIDDSGECGGKVGERIDSVEFAGFDERGDGRPVLRTCIVPGEKCILPIEGNRPDGPLNGILVNLDAAYGFLDRDCMIKW